MDSSETGPSAPIIPDPVDPAIQATESAYQELLDDVTDAVLDCSPEGRFLFANSAACESSGYTRRELLAMNIQQLFAPDSLPAMKDLMEAAQGAAELESREVQLAAKNGSRLSLRMKARVLKPDGGVAGIRWIGQDCTVLKRAQERIRQLEDTARIAFQLSPDSVAINRLEDGEYVEVNDGFLQTMGYTREELLGSSSLDLGIWADPAERARMVATLIRDGVVQNFEARFRRKNGRIEAGLMSAHIATIRGERYVLSVTRGLTSWTAARRALLDSEAHLEHVQLFGQRLMAAIEHASDEVTILDKNGLIQYCNPAWLRNFGYKLEQVIGQSLAFLRSGRPEDEFFERIETTLRERVAWSGRLSSRRKDDSHVVLDATVSPIFGESGEPIGLVAVSRDVTQQLAMEARLQQAERLESIGRLAGGVAHDFNNFLTVINGYCALLLMSMSEDVPARRKVREIQKAGERATAVTQQLLAFSRKQVVRPRPLSLNAVIQEAEQMLRQVVGEGVKLSIDLETELGLVIADPGQMHQVLLNLALNARDAMPLGGEFSIRTRNLEIDEPTAILHPELRSGPCVSWVLTDTGLGIDPALRPHIFEPFFTTKAIGKGTGLGLATVYGIVRQSEGWIGLESAAGVGTTFTIYLPRTASGPLPDETPQAEPEDLSGTETILVVEDQEEVLRLAAETVASRGYRVLTATSGEGALNLAARYSGPIHLLLSDILMPGMNGRELAERFRTERPEMGVLFMSAHDPGLLAGRFSPVAWSSYLSKPFTPSALAAKIREVLDRR